MGENFRQRSSMSTFRVSKKQGIVDLHTLCAGVRQLRGEIGGFSAFSLLRIWSVSRVAGRIGGVKGRLASMSTVV